MTATYPTPDAELSARLQAAFQAVLDADPTLGELVRTIAQRSLRSALPIEAQLLVRDSGVEARVRV